MAAKDTDNGAAAVVEAPAVARATDAKTEYLMRRANVTMDDVPSVPLTRGTCDPPRCVAPGKPTNGPLKEMKFKDANGKDVKKVPSCMDVNEHLDYALLDEKDATENPVFSSGGWFPMHKNNPGGAHVHDGEFDADGFCRVGALTWHFSDARYAKAQQTAPVEKTLALVKQHSKPKGVGARSKRDLDPVLSETREINHDGTNPEEQEDSGITE